MPTKGKAKSIYRYGAFGISKNLVNLDDIEDENGFVTVIIKGNKYSFKHARDNTNRLSGMGKVHHLFKNIKEFDYDYDPKRNAIVMFLPDEKIESTVDENDVYSLFAEELRRKAERMARYYQIFFCLENYIRNLIVETLESVHGPNWWDICVNDTIKENVRNIKKREEEQVVSARSQGNIDYTNFGELQNIVIDNWEHFESRFRSKKAFNKIMTTLNTLRGQIAHCTSLDKDEEERFELSLKDWFKRCFKE